MEGVYKQSQSLPLPGFHNPTRAPPNPVRQIGSHHRTRRIRLEFRRRRGSEQPVPGRPSPCSPAGTSKVIKPPISFPINAGEGGGFAAHHCLP
uniref:Uncharacterized protein n=1 Tax=Aegilops tauschii TaxID=37682 RepID=M8BMG3_AEGTA